jgi:hypothetical protein
MRGHRESVKGGKPLVNADVTEFRVEKHQADWSRAIDVLEFSEVTLGVVTFAVPGSRSASRLGDSLGIGHP